MIIHNCLQSTPEWFELRAGRVTGTRFKTLMMGKTTKGYRDLIDEIACEVITEGVNDQEFSYTSPIMERGKDMEPIAREVFREVTGFNVGEVGFITPDEDHEFAEWTGISPDGIIYETKRIDITPVDRTNILAGEDQIIIKGRLYQKEFNNISGLEIKCPLAKTHFGYLESGELPSDYIHQVQGAMHVSGLESWYFMSYYPKMKPFIIEVKPDPDLHLQYESSLRELVFQVKKKIEIYKEYDYEI